MKHVPTPHIEADENGFAKTVLMPGDPLRARYIAENYLTDVRQVNGVRGMLGYTGKYNGIPVSVMASGMGIPSIGIYSYELYNFYGADNIIRIGSAGALSEKIKVRDMVFGMSASTDSSYALQYGLPGTYAPTADFGLLRLAAETADKLGYDYHVGNILSSDRFYNLAADANELWKSMGVLAIEMEAAGLYMNAAKAGKRALAICTVSDHILTGESLSSQEREKTFTDMMTLALECAVKL